jgi:hypothetical protein
VGGSQLCQPPRVVSLGEASLDEITVPDDIQDLRRKAGFVFVGTVEKLGAVATADVSASPTTAVVRVDHVVHAPEELAGNLGRAVTVNLATKDLEEGSSATFFATSWVYGRGLALQEIGHTAHTDVGEVIGLLSDAAREIHAGRIADRAELATLIVLGRVARIGEPADATPDRRPASEHDAHWWIAEIDAEELLKGRRQRKPIALAFPTSKDVAWYGAPRPQANQRAVWLLHKEEHRGLPADAYVALDPRDVQPPETAAHIRELTKG